MGYQLFQVTFGILKEKASFEMKDTAWMGEVLQDMAAFAVENDLPNTYDALIKAMEATTTETRQEWLFPQRTSDNVIPLFQRADVKTSHP